MRSKADWTAFLRRIERAGWRIEIRPSGHLRAHSPEGDRWVDFSKTPGNVSRAILNVRARFRRAGCRI